MSTVTVIPCGAKKLEIEAPASQLYTGAMFTQGWRAAQALGHEVLIMSGLHGLVKPSKKLKPYDVQIKNNPKITATVGRQVKLLKEAGVDTIVAMLPSAYLKVLKSCADAQGIQVVNMYDRCEGRRGIGCQKHVLKLIIENRFHEGA